MRKVKVALEADVVGFVGQVKVATKSVDDLGDKVGTLDRSLGKIPPDALKAGAALKMLDGDVKSVGTTVDSIGTKNTGLAVLDSKIRETQKEVRTLGDEFVKTGDLDVFKKLSEASGKLEGLKAVRSTLKDAIVGGTEDAFKNLGPGFKNFWKDAFGSMGGGDLATIGITAGVILAAAAAPVIGAGISGALLAGAAAGPLALGIKQSLNDPRVQAELDHLSLKIGDTLQRSTTYFAPVMERAFQTLGQSWDRLSPQIEQTFVNTAPLVDKLVKGVTELGESAMPGFVKATGAAGPVFDQIENTLHAIGIELGDMFSMLAKHSDKAASAVQFFGMLASGSIATVSALLETLLSLWGRMVDGAERGSHVLESMFGWVPGVGGQLRDLNSVFHMLNQTAHGEGTTGLQVYGRTLGGVDDSVQKLAGRSQLLAGSMSDAAVKAGSLKAALDQLNGAAISSEQAELQYQAAVDKVTESVTQNGVTHDADTEKGRANREALLALVTATEAKVEATYNDTYATKDKAAADEAATAAAKEGREAVIAAARAMGYSQGEAEAYANKLLAIPGNVSTKFKIYGTDDANDQIKAIKASLDRVPGTKTININVKADLPDGLAMGALMHRAAGGPVAAGTPYVVGDGGQPEVFVPNVDGTIVPSLSRYASMRGGYANMRATGHAASGGRGGGGGEMTHRLVVETTSGVELLNMILDAPLGPQRLGSAITYLHRNGLINVPSMR